jgi:hypothetical protein
LLKVTANVVPWLAAASPRALAPATLVWLFSESGNPFASSTCATEYSSVGKTLQAERFELVIAVARAGTGWTTGELIATEVIDF